MELPTARAHDETAIQAEISSVTTHSRHSSVNLPQTPQTTDPYGRTTNCFPICNTVSSDGPIESYSRSFLFTGNGFPIFKVARDLNRPTEYLERGVGIGDVGIMDPRGDFIFAFNIFADPDDPIHSQDIPAEFQQYPHPEPTDITVTKDFLPSGSVISTKGVHIARLQESPLKLTISTNAREAGVLILPEGASREDWSPTSDLHRYLELHALDWYQQITNNIKASVTTVPNGAIYLVTGVDRAPSLSTVAIPGRYQRAGNEQELRYNGTNPRDLWMDPGGAETSNKKTDEGPYAIFIRGTKISLSHKSWLLNFDAMPREETPYYNLLSTPIIGFMSRLVHRKERLFGVPYPYLSGRQKVFFHPSDVLAQIMFEEFPEAECALIDDAVWNSQISSTSDGTQAEVIKLLVRILEAYEGKVDGKFVTLLPKPQKAVEPQSLFTRLMANFSSNSARVRVLKALNPQ